MPEGRLELMRAAYEFAWPREYVFKCFCGDSYRRGDIVSKKCCLSAMDSTPGLNWAAWSGFTTDRDHGDEA